MAYSSGWTAIVGLQSGQEVSNKYDGAFTNIDLALADIDSILNGLGYDKIQFIPQATEPTALTEGAMYYDLPTHSFVAIDDITGTRLNLGHEVNERAYNPDLVVTIPEGRAVAVTSTDANDVIEIGFADASTLDTAVAFGMTTSTFGPESVGKVTKLGRVNSVDTAGILVNGVVYLSDVGDGSLTGTAPEIATVIGYVIKEQSAPAVADGVIYVDPQSIVALPNVVAFMNQDTPTASTTLTATPIAISSYDELDSNGIIMDYDFLTGIITAPSDGIYDMTIDFGTNYNDIGNSIQHLLVEIMADNGVDAPYRVGQYNKEVAKNSTSTNGSMTKTFNGERDVQYYLQISCPDDTFANFVLENVSFSLKSIDIR